MISAETILDSMNHGQRNITFKRLDTNRYLIGTGCCFPDGDELHIVLKRDGRDWILSDEGYTMMWMSYEGRDSIAVLDDALCINGAELSDGRIIVRLVDRSVSDCLQSMIRVLSQAADLLQSCR